MDAERVLVTGGAGFVGGHLVEELIKLKANVFVVDINLDKRSYLFTEKLHRKSRVINLDICDYKKLLGLIKKYRIEFIFHLAAQALVEEAYKNPKYTLDNNILSGKIHRIFSPFRRSSLRYFKIGHRSDQRDLL